MAEGGVTSEIGPEAAEAAGAAVPHPAPGLEIAPARARDGRAVVSLPAGRFFEVSSETATLLALVDGRRDLTALAGLLAERGAPPLPPAALRELIDHALAPRGLVHWGEPPPEQARPASPMWLRLPLLAPSVVNAAAALFAPLFRPAPAALAGALALAAHAWFYLSGPRLGLDRDLYRVPEWLPPALLYYLSIAAHEFGHAAALRRFGEPAGEIGFGLYRVFPVFFTDVSRAWRLPRVPRAVVDAGGMYVQVLFAAVLIAIHAATRDVTAARAAVLIDLSLIGNLNPFLRMDGYWLASDLSGTRDLRARSLERLRALVGLGTPGAPRASRFLTLYTVFSMAYFAALAIALVFGVAPALARQMIVAWRALRAAPAPAARIEPALFLVLGGGLVIAAIVLLARGARRLARRPREQEAATPPG